MAHIKKIVAALAVASPLFALAQPSPPPNFSVTITNPATNPANVKVTNTPLPVTGSLTVSGTPNVNVTNTPSVVVGNTAAAPVLASRVDEPARAPYLAEFRLSCTGSSVLCSGVIQDIGAGRRLVIQHVSVFALDSGANWVRARLSNAQAVATNFLVPISPPAAAANQIAAIDQTVQFYIDGGTGILGAIGSIEVSTDGNFALTQEVFATISGYLISCSATLPCAPISP